MKCRLKRASSSRLGEILHWEEEENTKTNEKPLFIFFIYLFISWLICSFFIYTFCIFKFLLLLFLCCGNNVQYLNKYYTAYASVLLSTEPLVCLIVLFCMLMSLLQRGESRSSGANICKHPPYEERIFHRTCLIRQSSLAHMYHYLNSWLQQIKELSVK